MTTHLTSSYTILYKKLTHLSTLMLSFPVGCGGADGLVKSITLESEAYAIQQGPAGPYGLCAQTHTHTHIRPGIPLRASYPWRRQKIEHLGYMGLLQNCIKQSHKHNEKPAYLHFAWYNTNFCKHIKMK